MAKVYKAILLFSASEHLAAGLEVQSRTQELDMPVYVFDDHFPLDREKNLRGMEIIKKRWPALTIFHSDKNLGIHNAFNALTAQMPLEDDDIIIWSTADNIPHQKGWDKAMVQALEGDPNLAWVGLSTEYIRLTPNINFTFKKSNGIMLEYPNGATINSTTAFRWSFLKAIGGLWEPCKYYGYLEIHLWHKCKEQGMSYAFLSDYTEDYNLGHYHPEIYTKYKQDHASGKFPESFKEYLDAQKSADHIA